MKRHLLIYIICFFVSGPALGQEDVDFKSAVSYTNLSVNRAGDFVKIHLNYPKRGSEYTQAFVKEQDRQEIRVVRIYGVPHNAITQHKELSDLMTKNDNIENEHVEISRSRSQKLKDDDYENNNINDEFEQNNEFQQSMLTSQDLEHFGANQGYLIFQKDRNNLEFEEKQYHESFTLVLIKDRYITNISVYKTEIETDVTKKNILLDLQKFIKFIR